MNVAKRVEELLNKMTLEEKIAQMDMIRGVSLATKGHPAHFCAVDETSDFYWDRVDRFIGAKGIGFVHDVYGTPEVLNKLQRYFVEKTRLGIPCIFTGEALHGLSYPGATIFPMPLNLGAAFNPELTRAVGHAIGAETRALGIQEILAPNLDVARDPRWGRMEETFGEDTYLSSRMAYALISGEQGEDISSPESVVCEPKHYLAHGFPESGLNCASARAGQREILSEYLPVFEAGICKAGAYNAMASYNNIDGTPMICSSLYLQDVLKGKMGLKGYVRADFGAVNRLRTLHHMTREDKDSIALAVNNGLDVQGFDFPNHVWQQCLRELVDEGRVAMETINDSVRRILRVKFELGLFDHPYTEEKRHRQVVRSEEHRNLSLQAARESIVMLKNDGVLPLNPDVRSIALLGPSSNHQRVGSYSSVPYGYRVPSVYEELKNALPEVEIWQEDGCSISEKDMLLIPASWYSQGVEVAYYAQADFTKPPVGVDTFPDINFNWGFANPHPALSFSGYGARLSGRFRVDAASVGKQGDFDGMLFIPTRDSIRLWVDGELLIDSRGEQKQRVPGAAYRFVDGTEHDFLIEFVYDVNGRNIAFSLATHLGDSIDEAVELARKADLTILVCGDDTVTSGEGMDRSEIKLHGRQRELIRRVGELGKPSVLVLEVGKAVDLSDESPLMKGILVPWFGGELGARAIVEALTGRIDPSGRLPVSFPRSVGHLPCYYSKLPGGSKEYIEGTEASLYPFGHGMSYTEFALDSLQAEITGPQDVRVNCTVTNIGQRAGTAVLQLYVEDPVSSVVTPDKRLCAFERVELMPGESREIAFELGFEAFRLLNAKLQWVVEPGEFVLHLGFSSTDIRQSVSVQL